MRQNDDEELFGEVALRLGYVSVGQLYKALTQQRRSERRGRETQRLGAILIEMGAMTPEQVSDVLEELASD
jgi:hypothetical protein